MSEDRNKLELHLQEPYFSLIKEGKKTIEVRLNKPKFHNLKKGDQITFNGNLTLQVTKADAYPSFKRLFEKENLESILPNTNTLEDALSVYYGFYSKEDEKAFGVIAIHLSKKIIIT